ncbi:hypothetical protein GCM10012282_74050 [Streptomyces lacrimifluminis]|uniref:Uncharacterized protein n=1 Tax=Streptomyces lacrimifluminis TaxID=1500077 RepID=A0A917P7Z2_9ACTN|nr:hypothetical protein GCM10012282_74050 [Streptomyces lacrimifluminis]
MAACIEAPTNCPVSGPLSNQKTGVEAITNTAVTVTEALRPPDMPCPSSHSAATAQQQRPPTARTK